jgi:hypothetical protein
LDAPGRRRIGEEAVDDRSRQPVVDHHVGPARATQTSSILDRIGISSRVNGARHPRSDAAGVGRAHGLSA